MKHNSYKKGRILPNYANMLGQIGMANNLEQFTKLGIIRIGNDQYSINLAELVKQCKLLEVDSWSALGGDLAMLLGKTEGMVSHALWCTNFSQDIPLPSHSKCNFKDILRSLAFIRRVYFAEYDGLELEVPLFIGNDPLPEELICDCNTIMDPVFFYGEKPVEVPNMHGMVLYEYLIAGKHKNPYSG